MRYYLKDKSNKVFEFNLTRNQVRLAIKNGRWQYATLAERRDFLLARDAEEEAFLKDNRYINIYYKAPTHNPDGYGNSSRQFKERAKKYGIYFNEVQKGQKVGLLYSIANELIYLKTPVKLCFTMFESDKFPFFWEEHMRLADLVIVPAPFIADVLKKQWGIEALVVPLGFESNNFHYVDRTRPANHPFTFLHYDAFKWRKGWDLILNAFDDEFGTEIGEGDDVRLIFKTTLEYTPPLHAYPKISVIKGRLPQEHLIELHQKSDCFVFPTRGEGYGLTPLEALATGMPAIVPNHTGISSYFNSEFCYDVNCKPIPAKYDNLELRGIDCGNWLEPSYSDLRAQMRQAYNDWKAKTGKYSLGNDKKMAEYAKQFDVDNTVKTLCEIIKRYV